jgi:hypothetical protein
MALTMALTLAATATTTGAGTIVSGGIHVALSIDLNGSGVSVADGVADYTVEFGVLYSRGLDRGSSTGLSGELGQSRGCGRRRACTGRKIIIDLAQAIIGNHKSVTTGTCTASHLLLHHRGLGHATAGPASLPGGGLGTALLLNGHIHRGGVTTGETIAHECAGLQRNAECSGKCGTSVTPATSTLTLALTLALALALTGMLHFSI